MSLPTLVCATANPDKVFEIDALLDGLVEVLPRPTDLGDVVEDGETLVDNARLKAVAVCEAAGHAAVADDTGLEVDALDGAPGVYSGRFAGPEATYEQNVAKLLADLEAAGALDPEQRTARFRTVVMVRYPDGDELVVEGVCEGTIASSPNGEGGFGYDPVFVPVEGDGRPFALMSPVEKNEISHRGRAFRSLVTAFA